jgi:site-specific DNA-methyltransferase (cytosine-N4-specific)
MLFPLEKPLVSHTGYTIREGSYANSTQGAIQRNVLEFGHACADQRRYKQQAREIGLPVHGAPMPLSLAHLLVKYLTKPGDLVVDCFAGSHTTPKAA